MAKAAAKPKIETKKPEVIAIRPPNFRTAVVSIKGASPYVQNRFSEKAQREIEERQRAGSQAGSKRTRTPKDFEALYKAAFHVARQGWYGIPCPAFRDACISSCRLVGFKMTHAKLSLFIVPDGFDKIDGTPLVQIFGKPRAFTVPVRPAMGGVDLRVRPIWDEWNAKVKIRWDADQFSASDIVNLMARVGAQVGVGEGRADSPNSNGQGWGHFEVVGSAK